jgi:SAM-dependent methyltransferase
MGLREWLTEPAVRGVNVDSPDLIDVHRRVLESKPMIRGVFEEIYRLCRTLDERYLSGDGLRVEVGAGISLMHEVYQEVLATDVKASPYVQLVVDALAMPFDAGSVRTIYGINCFHHFADPDRFFDELERVVVAGGGAVLVDPYHGPFARWLYPRLFTTERYDPNQANWTAPGSDMGTMTGANQALTYVVFVRGRERLAETHPGLELVGTLPITNYPRYLLSGGLNFRQLAPTIAIGPLKVVERAMRPLGRALALHHAIVIRKRSTDRVAD